MNALEVIARHAHDPELIKVIDIMVKQIMDYSPNHSIYPSTNCSINETVEEIRAYTSGHYLVQKIDGQYYIMRFDKENLDFLEDEFIFDTKEGVEGWLEFHADDIKKHGLIFHYNCEDDFEQNNILED